MFFPFQTWFEKGGGQKFKEKNSTVNRFEALSPLPVKPVGNRLAASPANSRECQMWLVPEKADEYAPDVSPQGRIPRSAGTPCNPFCFPRRRANHRALESDAWP